jgi:8-oxo-dGTP pyrophosphatase MutT (NUDIX family)
VDESQAPRERRAARVLAVSDAGRVLLLRGGDPARPGIGIWHAPGGGLESDEQPADAAAREFVEETGHEVEIGPLVWDRTMHFSFDRVVYDQYEVFFLARVGAEFEADSQGHADHELEYLSGYGWFAPDDLRAMPAPDLVAPPDLADRLDELLREGPPASPVRVGGAVLP